MSTDNNDYRAADMTAPAEDGVAMVKAVPLAKASRAIYVGTTGDVEAVMRSGNTVMFKNMPVGWHAIRVTQITNNTTASNVVAIF